MARELYSHPSRSPSASPACWTTASCGRARPGCFQYAPRRELDRTVGRVAEMYRERRVAVISLIASKPIENVKAFSDAFRIRRKKEGD